MNEYQLLMALKGNKNGSLPCPSKAGAQKRYNEELKETDFLDWDSDTRLKHSCWACKPGTVPQIDGSHCGRIIYLIKQMESEASSQRSAAGN